MADPDDSKLDDRTVRDQNTLVNTMPSPITALDGLGVERIIATTHDYTPPQVDPDPKEVARLAALQTRLDNKKQERLASLTGTPDSNTGASVAADAIKAESNVGTTSADASTPAPATADTDGDGKVSAKEKAAAKHNEQKGS
jgi:hypothetical protein